MNCPKCSGKIIEKKTKKGKIFYGCNNYPKCDFATWNEPIDEKCPNCGEDMIVKLYKNMKVISCVKCDYSRREKNEKTSAASNSVGANDEISQFDEIEILNKLDEQNYES